jgi:hypothetical protein
MGIGIVSPYSGSQISEDQVYLHHGYGYPLPEGSSGTFVYDIATRTTTEMAFGYFRNTHFHPGVVLGNNHGGECTCDPGAPRPLPPNVLLYDIRTGQKYDTGVDGYLMYSPTVFDGETFALSSTEATAREDVNGDGDWSDGAVIYVSIRRAESVDDPVIDDPASDLGTDSASNLAIGGRASVSALSEGLWVLSVPLLLLGTLQIVLPVLRRRRLSQGRHP